MTMVTWKIVDQFFDRALVVKAVNKAKKRECSKAGAFIRRTARRSIKPVGKRARKAKRNRTGISGIDPTVSRPGQPPRMHTVGARNLRTILFGWDAARESVVIGPVKFPRSGNAVPSLLEYGGSGKVRKLKRGQRRRKNGRLKTRTVTVRYAPRPYMNPALVKEAPKFPALFRNSVSR